MRLNKFFKGVHAFEKSFFLLSAVSNSMTRHRNRKDVALSFDHRVNFFKSVCGYRCLKVVLSLTVSECEEALTNGVTVAHFTVVDECNVLVAPREKVTRNLAAQRARSQQKALS